MSRWQLDYFAGEGDQETVTETLATLGSYQGIRGMDALTVSISVYNENGVQIDVLSLTAAPDELALAFALATGDDDSENLYSVHVTEGESGTGRRPPPPVPPPPPPPPPPPKPTRDERGRFVKGGVTFPRDSRGRFVKSGR